LLRKIWGKHTEIKTGNIDIHIILWHLEGVQSSGVFDLHFQKCTLENGSSTSSFWFHASNCSLLDVSAQWSLGRSIPYSWTFTMQFTHTISLCYQTDSFKYPLTLNPQLTAQYFDLCKWYSYIYSLSVIVMHLSRLWPKALVSSYIDMWNSV
jgi:hypothetical protein